MTPKAQHLSIVVARLCAQRRLVGQEIDKIEGRRTPGPEERPQLEALSAKWLDFCDEIANEAEELCIELGLLPIDESADEHIESRKALKQIGPRDEDHRPEL